MINSLININFKKLNFQDTELYKEEKIKSCYRPIKMTFVNMYIQFRKLKLKREIVYF